MGKAPARKLSAEVVASPTGLQVVDLLPVDKLAHPMKDVPGILGVSKATLYRMVEAGEVQPRSLHGCIVVRRVDLQALVDAAPLSKKVAQ